jgi:hypothetical protein
LVGGRRKPNEQAPFAARAARRRPRVDLPRRCAQPVKVGIAQDLTGPFAALGAEARDGFNLAIKQLGGKLGGIEAEFLTQDMAGNPDQARQLVERFIKRDKVDFFTGPIGSNVALAVGPTFSPRRSRTCRTMPGRRSSPAASATRSSSAPPTRTTRTTRPPAASPRRAGSRRWRSWRRTTRRGRIR